VRRGLRARPPTHMTEGGYTGFAHWDPFTESRVDRAIGRTRNASVPLLRPGPGRPP
jgi:acetoin utilization protein AcuC